MKISKISAKIHEIGKIKAIGNDDSHIRPKKWPNKITVTAMQYYNRLSSGPTFLLLFFSRFDCSLFSPLYLENSLLSLHFRSEK